MTRAAKWIAITVVTASILAGTGCSSARAQMVYSIDGEVTTINQVVAVTDSCNLALKGRETVSLPWVINAMIQSDLAHRVAKAEAIVYDEQTDLRDHLRAGDLTPQGQAMMGDPVCADVATGLALKTLVINQINTGGYEVAARKFTVAVNPRFGQWDTAQLTVSGTGSLSHLDTPGG